MLKVRLDKKGVVLLIVLAVVLVTAILAAGVMSLILSHYRLSHHQTSRIQAYYADLAGINYAIEMLRLGPSLGGWDTNSCPPLTPCPVIFNSGDFTPASIVGNRVLVVIRAAGAVGCSPPGGISACIDVTADYAYTP